MDHLHEDPHWNKEEHQKFMTLKPAIRWHNSGADWLLVIGDAPVVHEAGTCIRISPCVARAASFGEV